MPLTSNVGKFGVQKADISIDLISVDTEFSKSMSLNWNKTSEFKKGYLYEIPDWKEAEISIEVYVPTTVNLDKTIVHINCDVTNFYQFIECKKNGERTIDGVKLNKYSATFILYRNNFSGIVSLYADILKNEKLVAESSFFQIFTDKRVPPELGNSLFDWRISDFSGETENNLSVDLQTFIDEFSGKKFYSLITPSESNDLTTIYMNSNYNKIFESIVDENINKNLQGLRDLMILYFSSNAYMYEFSSIMLLLSSFKLEYREQYNSGSLDEANAIENVYSDLKEELENETADINFKKINAMSLMLYPELKNEEKLRVYKFWKSSIHDESKDLFIRFNLAFQKEFNPSAKLEGFNNLLEIIEDSTGSNEDGDRSGF